MRKQLIMIIYLIVSLICGFSKAASLDSKNKDEIFALLRENLLKANDVGAEKKISFGLQVHPTKQFSESIANNNQSGAGFRIDAPQIRIVKNGSEIGYINWDLGKGLHSILFHQNDKPSGSKEISDSNYFATLGQITINPNYQGGGNSSIAMDMFLKLLDGIGVNYTFLGVSSDKPFTASIYHRRGFRFTENTMAAIKEHIGTEELFLKDSQQNLGKAAFMVRWRPEE